MTPATTKMIDEIMDDLSEIEGISFNQQLTLIPTGIDLLDTIAGGGIPVGKLISIAGAPGGGKCLGKGTPILMYDGSVKKVEDIVVGDIVMGDDSTPRNVLAITSGQDEMYEVKPSRGDSYIVNSKHILSLKYISGVRNFRGQKKGDIIDINVIDFMNSNNWFKHEHLGYRVGVEFEFKEIPIDPYYLGIWLGDGNKESPCITTADIEIENFIKEYAKERDLFVTESLEAGTKTTKRFAITGQRIKTNSLLEDLRSLNVTNNKHIPQIYKCNSREVRLQLLAGLLDSDGALRNDTKGSFTFVNKSEQLIDDVIFLARSLGLSAYKSSREFSYNGINSPQTYFEIAISGDVYKIPTKVERKKVTEKVKREDMLHTTLQVMPIGVGDYYGFQIDGNQRFLLGDFTVTHNSTLAGRIAASFQSQYEKAMVFYVDSEQAMSYDRLKVLGCDLDRTLLISEVITLENVCKVVEKIIQFKIKKKLIDIPFVFIWDSESASPTEKQLTIDDPAKLMGFKARLLSHILPKMTMDCNKYNITPILINQLRDKIDMNMYQADVGGLKGMGDKTITGGNVMKFLPFQLILVRPKENIDAEKFGFSGVISELKFIKNKNYIPHIKIDLVLDYMKGYSDFWTKQRLLQTQKAIKGTSWQYLDTCKDKKFRKKEIEDLYFGDEEFKKCFEEIYEELKKDVTKTPDAEAINKSNEEIDENEELPVSNNAINVDAGDLLG